MATILANFVLPLGQAQVKIKEKIVLTPKGKKMTKDHLRSLQSGGGQDSTQLTFVTVKYYYRACDGFGVVKTALSPCNNSYVDTARGNTVTDKGQQGLAQYTFTAYDAGTYLFNVNPHFDCPDVTCLLLECNDSVVVTDN